MDERRYLFIVGCPRSGTTALAWLLNQHPNIAIGPERYGSRFLRKEFLDRSLFEHQRFYDLRPGDTFYSHVPDAMRAFESKFDTVDYRGDKLPQLYGYLPRLFQEFGTDVRVIFLLRNPFDVASSFERRARNTNDHTWKLGGAASGVEYWSRAIRQAALYCADERVYFLSYEQLFQAGLGVESLLNFLEIPVDAGFMTRYQQVLEGSATLEVGRDRLIDWRVLDLIGTEAPFDDYRKVRHRAAEQALL